MTEKWVEVAIGIFVREDGRVLLGSRPEGKPYAGYWEFPGGKIEPGETAHACLVREAEEELGLRVTASVPWFVKEHRYEHASVRLHFRRVSAFEGVPVGREGQAFGYFLPTEKTPGTLLPADVRILNRTGLPEVWQATPDMPALSVEALRAGGQREPRCRFTGARVQTAADMALALAADLDFAVVPEALFASLFSAAEPRLPVYVQGPDIKDLPRWQACGAHGVAR